MVRAALDINHSRRRKALYKVPSADLNPGYHRLGARKEVSGDRAVVPRRLDRLCLCVLCRRRPPKLLMHSSPKTLVIFCVFAASCVCRVQVCARVTCERVRRRVSVLMDGILRDETLLALSSFVISSSLFCNLILPRGHTFTVYCEQCSQIADASETFSILLSSYAKPFFVIYF